MSTAVRIRRVFAGITVSALVAGGLVVGAAPATAATTPHCFALGSTPDESTVGCVITDVAAQFLPSSDVTKPGLHSAGSSQLTQGHWGEDAQIVQSSDGSFTISYKGSKPFWIRQGGYLLLLDEPVAHLDAEGNGSLFFYGRRYPTPNGTFSYGTVVRQGTVEVLEFTGGTPAQSENGFISWPDLTAEWSPDFAVFLEQPSPSTAFPTAVVDRVRAGNSVESPSTVAISTEALAIIPELRAAYEGAAVVGQEAAFTATMTHPAIINGDVTLSRVDGDTVTPLDTAEVAAFQSVAETLSWTPTSAGEVTLRSTYLSHIATAVGLPSTLEITVVDPTTTTLSIPSTATVGGTVTATVTVEGVSTLPDPDTLDGEVTFWDGTQLLGSGQAVDGRLSKSLTLPRTGTRQITARFEDQRYFAGSTSAVKAVRVVGKPSSTGLAVSKTSELYGRAVTLTATVGGAGATGSVRFFDGSKDLGTATVVGGKAVKKVILDAGTRSIRASYLGSATFATSTSTAKTVKVSKATTSKVTLTDSKFSKNTKPKVKVTVAKLNNGAYPVGKVQVFVAGKLVTTANLSSSQKGKVTITLPSTYSKSIAVKATFVPSTANVSGKSSKTVTVKVKK